MSTEQLTSSRAHTPSDVLDRRRFLAASTVAASGAILLAAGSFSRTVGATSQADPAFVGLARFLVGKKDFDARIIALAYSALAAADSGFAAKATMLARAIENEHLPDVNAFAKSALYADATHRATAIAVISAFYLGQVGEGKNAKFVSFEKALMFAPTAGIVVIPTYALGGPNYWGKITTLPSD